MTQKDLEISNNIIDESLSFSLDKRKIIYETIINSICKIVIDEKQKSYGFFCRIPNRKNSPNDLINILITRLSTLSLQYIKSKPYIELSLNEDKIIKKIILNDKRIYYTSENLNLTFIEIKPEVDEINSDYFLDIDEKIFEEDLNSIYKNKNIYIIEKPHFQTDYIHLSIINDIDDNLVKYETKTGFKCCYTPVFNLDNNKIIGIGIDDNNTYENRYNNSLCFKSIINEFNNRNEIIISIDLMNKNRKKINDIYFISEEFNKEKNNTQILDESNLDLYINNKKVEFKRYFKPESEEFYIIKIKFNKNILVNCLKMFNKCKLITKIDLSSFNFEKVTNMSYMFSDCNNLTNINISHLNAENVLDMSYIFQNCGNLNNIDLSSIKTNHLSNMQNMFYLCNNLTDINFTNFNTQNVTNMNSLFKECHSLKSLDLSFFNFDKVKTLNSIFESCLNLSNIKLNKNLNSPNLINMEKMFYDCQNLENINDIFNLFNTSKVQNMSCIFYGCKNLKKLNLNFEKLDTSNVTDMSKMFFRCKNLYYIEFNGKFNTKNVKNMSQMFAYCNNLVSLDLSKFNTENVESMEEMFSFCPNLTNINLSNFNIKNVNNMKKMFYNCNSLSRVELDFKKSDKIVDINNLFTNCFNMHFVNLYNLNSKKVKNIQTISLLKNCFNLLGAYLNKETYLELKPFLNNLAIRFQEKGI